MDTTSVFAPIMKSTEQDDGTLLVYGKATGSDLDLDQQRCDPAWLSRAVPEWFKIGNIREQHDAHRAVGKATEHDARDDGHYITAKIVDPVAVAKAKAGIFTGFSIGIKSPRVTKSADAPNGTITDGKIIEVSIVDSPCLPTATLTLVKSATPGMELNAADFDEATGLVRCEELVEKTTAVEQEETGMTATLAEKLDPEQVEKLAAAAPGEETPEDAPATVEKADAPADAPAEEVVEKAIVPEFDRAAAVAFVEKVLGDGEDGDAAAALPEASDISAASAAIAICAGLIQSEAQGMVECPNEDADIYCLLNAVGALRRFIRNERNEKPADMAVVDDFDAMLPLAAHADASKAADAEPPAVETRPTVKAPEPTAPPLVEPDNTKTTDPDAAKASVVEDEDPAAALVKALSVALEKSDSPLRALFEAIVKASTDAIAESAETTAEAVSDLAARLVKVENMAVPGGPALRRTEVERAQSRRNDLASEVMRFKALAAHATDVDLRTGYTAKAAQLETELKAL